MSMRALAIDVLLAIGCRYSRVQRRSRRTASFPRQSRSMLFAAIRSPSMPFSSACRKALACTIISTGRFMPRPSSASATRMGCASIRSPSPSPSRSRSSRAPSPSRSASPVTSEPPIVDAYGLFILEVLKAWVDPEAEEPQDHPSSRLRQICGGWENDAVEVEDALSVADRVPLADAGS